MNRTTWTRAITVAVCAAALATAAVDAATAGAQPAKHTMHFTIKQLQDKVIGQVDVATDKQMHNGSVTGYDASACRINVKTHIANCDLGAARKQGLLYVHARINVNTGSGHGQVLGGTRAFKNASGTVTVHGSQVTVVYSG